MKVIYVECNHVIFTILYFKRILINTLRIITYLICSYSPTVQATKDLDVRILIDGSQTVYSNEIKPEIKKIIQNNFNSLEKIADSYSIEVAFFGDNKIITNKFNDVKEIIKYVDSEKGDYSITDFDNLVTYIEETLVETENRDSFTEIVIISDFIHEEHENNPCLDIIGIDKKADELTKKQVENKLGLWNDIESNNKKLFNKIKKMSDKIYNYHLQEYGFSNYEVLLVDISDQFDEGKHFTNKCRALFKNSKYNYLVKSFGLPLNSKYFLLNNSQKEIAKLVRGGRPTISDKSRELVRKFENIITFGLNDEIYTAELEKTPRKLDNILPESLLRSNICGGKFFINSQRPNCRQEPNGAIVKEAIDIVKVLKSNVKIIEASFRNEYKDKIDQYTFELSYKISNAEILNYLLNSTKFTKKNVFSIQWFGEDSNVMFTSPFFVDGYPFTNNQILNHRLFFKLNDIGETKGSLRTQTLSVKLMLNDVFFAADDAKFKKPRHYMLKLISFSVLLLGVFAFAFLLYDKEKPFFEIWIPVLGNFSIKIGDNILNYADFIIPDAVLSGKPEVFFIMTVAIYAPFVFIFYKMDKRVRKRRFELRKKEARERKKNPAYVGQVRRFDRWYKTIIFVTVTILGLSYVFLLAIYEG